MQIPQYLYNEHYDDRYFDVVNAIEEARHIFFKGNRLIERFSGVNISEREFIIGETGFGAGRLLIALIDYLDNSSLSGLSISYNSVELHPVTSERMASILGGLCPEVGSIVDLLVKSYVNIDVGTQGWHQMHFKRSFGSISMNLYIGEAFDMVEAINVPCDAWFLDGHGPKKNPSMWRPELLHAIGEKTRLEGTCATFTVAGEVRRNLTAAGFSVHQRPGFGGKKAVLCGIKR